MVYLVYMFNKELELPVMTVCKDQEHLAQLIVNLDKKYEVVDINHSLADFIDNSSELYVKPNDMEFGKGETNVDK